MYGLQTKTMHPESELRHCPRIYMAIPCLTEFSFQQSPKRAINGLVGHPALSLIYTGFLHPTVAQMTRGIQLHNYIHSKCTYKIYEDDNKFLSS